ncbi:hypothetical protein ACEZI6_004746 [Escherichia coli]
MLSKKLLLVCVSCLVLSACSVDEIAAVNKQISDGAFALTGALRGNNSSTVNSFLGYYISCCVCFLF